MRVRFIFLVLFMATGHTSHSQVLISILLGDELNTGKIGFGLDGGLSLSDIQGPDESNTTSNFNLGFYFDIRMKHPSWFLHTGVMVKSTLGAEDIPVYSLNDPILDGAFVGGSVTRKLRYFNMPALAKYRFKNNFFLEGGPMISLLHKSTDEFESTVKQKDDLTYTLDIEDQYHPLDVGLMGGVGYRLMRGNGMNLAIRYYYGLVDITIDDTTQGRYNRALYFAIGIPIGAGKKEVKKEE